MGLRHFTKLTQSRGGRGTWKYHLQWDSPAPGWCRVLLLGRYAEHGPARVGGEEPRAFCAHPHPSHRGVGRAGACGQDQQPSCTRPMLKRCKSCWQKLLTHRVKKTKASPLAHPQPARLAWAGFSSLVCHSALEISDLSWKEEGLPAAGALSPQTCRTQAGGSHETLQTLLLSPTAVPLQEPEGRWGQAGTGGGSPPAGWRAWWGLAMERRSRREGLAGHALSAAGTRLGSTLQPVASYCPRLASQAKPTQPNPTQHNTTPTQPHPNPT